MFLFWIFYAAYSIAAKYLLDYMDEWHLVLWLSLGNFLAVLAFLIQKGVRKELAGYLHAGPVFFSSLAAEEIFSFLGRGALIFAYALGSVALVSSVAALQPFLTLVYVLFLSIFIPGILKEETDKRTISMKFMAVVLIIIGIYLVS
jgi:drug/metabolite transporter (DMT)-like permease